MDSSGAPQPSINMPVLDKLRSAAGNHVPLSELGPAVERVHEALDALAAFGFGIERHPYLGAAYFGPAERLCPDQIEYRLDTRWVGRRVAVWNRVTSTNDLAAGAAASVANDGLVVLAEEQTAGRGRRGRSWTAPPRSSILMSVILFPPSHLAPPAAETAFGSAWLTALGAVATAEVVAAYTGRSATIKWPNDVRVGGKKIAGILVERALAPGQPASGRSLSEGPETACAAIVGIGLNVNIERSALTPDLRASATSLQIERNAALDRSDVARELIRRLDYWYDSGRAHGPDTLSTTWCALSEHLNRLVCVATPAGPVVGRLVALDLQNGLTVTALANSLNDEDQNRAIFRIAHADVLALEPVIDADLAPRTFIADPNDQAP